MAEAVVAEAVVAASGAETDAAANVTNGAAIGEPDNPDKETSRSLN